MHTVDEPDAEAYLERIGVPARPPAPTADLLRDLQERHLRTVPFENLDLHLGVPVDLAEPALLDKIVARRRGGFCYEVNGAFAGLLRRLGYGVTLLAARVYSGPRLGPPFDHVALRVEADGAPWLVDVGFGSFSRHPLRLDTGAGQSDPDGTFTVVEAPAGDLDVQQDGEPQYRLEAHPRDLPEFGPMCWWQQHSPDSHFARSTVCSMLTPTGRVTLSGRRLIVTTGPDRDEHDLPTDADILSAYRTHFGVALARVPDRMGRTLVPSAGEPGTEAAG